MSITKDYWRGLNLRLPVARHRCRQSMRRTYMLNISMFSTFVAIIATSITFYDYVAHQHACVLS
jgi:hypothetical protein